MQKKFAGLSLESMDLPAKWIGSLLGEVWRSGNHPIVLLSGQMGAGKTTFASKIVHSILDYVDSSTKHNALFVNSPTYTILNEYPLEGAKNETGEELSVYHFDLYRTHSEEEVSDLGFDDYWGKKGISIVEWWERSPSEFSQCKFRVIVAMEEDSEETRAMVVKLEDREWENCGARTASLISREF